MALAPDWNLQRGVASRGNLLLLLLSLLVFPAILPWTGALSLAQIPPESPEHTGAAMRFCFTFGAFLWFCFAIAVVGIRRRGLNSWTSLVSSRALTGRAVLSELGASIVTFVFLVIVGNVSNALLQPYQHDTALRSMVAQNGPEALAFLGLALTAGFVEEFVFRGYLQAQFTALLGSVTIGSLLQVGVFTLGHLYQGPLRLLSVFVIGSLLTAVAVWRRSLVPGMIAHGLGDGLIAFLYFAKKF